MKTILRTFFAISPLFFISNLHGQDAIFYQFNGSPIFSNPAFTGLAQKDDKSKARFVFNYNGGFSGINNYPKAMNLSWDQQINNLGGVGAHIFRDGNSFYTHTQIGGSYSTQLKISEQTMISAGAELGFNTKSIDPSQLRWGDQIVATQGFVNQTQEKFKTNISYFNSAAGIIVSSDHWIGGFSVRNINQPNISFFEGPLKLKPHYSGMLGYQFKVSEQFRLTPTFQFHVQQPFKTYLLGGMATIKGVQFSFQYQTYDKSLRYSDRLNLGVGYGFKSIRLLYNVSAYIDQSIPAGNQHEIGFRWLWDTKAQSKKTTKVLSIF